MTAFAVDKVAPEDVRDIMTDVVEDFTKNPVTEDELHAYVDNEKDFNKAAAEVSVPFKKLEQALERQGSGPFFNGSRYSLVDAAYAPFLQRHLFLEHIRKRGHIERFPRVKAWAEAIAQRPSTHSFPPAEFEAMYRDMVKRRATWISQFVTSSKAAAE